MSDTQTKKEHTALVIDDQEPVRDLIRDVLGKNGFETVRAAPDALRAIDILENFTADLLICDFSMPYLNGLDFAGAVRCGLTSAESTIPIIMLTGYADKEKVQAAAWLNIQAFIRKPVSIETLMSRVDFALDHPPEQVDGLIDASRSQQRIDDARAEKLRDEAKPQIVLTKQELIEHFKLISSEIGSTNADDIAEHLMVPNEKLELGDVVAVDITNKNGHVIIPEGSKVTERLKATVIGMRDIQKIYKIPVLPRDRIDD